VQEVTVENFLNIIQGNKDALKGIGSGKVIERYMLCPADSKLLFFL